MSHILLFVLIGLCVIVAHGLLILTASSLVPVLRRAAAGAYLAARRAVGSVTGGAR